MFKLVYFVPESHLEVTKAALFSAGAGRTRNYDFCCWQVAGESQFRPLPGSDPFLGNQQELTSVKEYRVEMICPEDLVKRVITALREAHPYEEPAFDLWPLIEVDTE